MQKCIHCQLLKPLSEYHYACSYRKRRRTNCKACHRERERKRLQAKKRAKK